MMFCTIGVKQKKIVKFCLQIEKTRGILYLLDFFMVDHYEYVATIKEYYERSCVR